MSPYACACQSTERLCDVCVDEHLSWWRGICQARGESWAQAIAKVTPIDRPWPRTERMRTIARRKVDDLTRDVRLFELLVDEVVVGAARWWDRQMERAG